MEGNADPKLREAARNSPELASLLGGVHRDPGPRYRRIAAIAAAAAVGVVALWYAGSALRARRPASEPAAEIDQSVYLLPIKTEQVAQGEETSPFQGFAVSVDTVPAGGVISIGGVVRGEAPVLANLECRGAEKLEVRADKAGFRPVRRQVGCRTDTLVKLTLTLDAR